MMIYLKISNESFWTNFRLTRSSESEPLWMSWNFYEFVNVRVDSAIAVNSMTHENEWCWWHFVVMFTFSQELWMVKVKVIYFQSEFMKSSFLPKYKRKIVRISAPTTQGRNPDNFFFVFWEKRWLHQFILKLTDL